MSYEPKGLSRQSISSHGFSLKGLQLGRIKRPFLSYMSAHVKHSAGLLYGECGNASPVLFVPFVAEVKRARFKQSPRIREA
eukprot:838370-Amphidinium_carterae.6